MQAPASAESCVCSSRGDQLKNYRPKAIVTRRREMLPVGSSGSPSIAGVVQLGGGTGGNA